eukprot:180263-Hanusia_phi.AAC.1
MGEHNVSHDSVPQRLLGAKVLYSGWTSLSRRGPKARRLMPSHDQKNSERSGQRRLPGVTGRGFEGLMADKTLIPNHTQAISKSQEVDLAHPESRLELEMMPRTCSIPRS